MITETDQSLEDQKYVVAPFFRSTQKNPSIKLQILSDEIDDQEQLESVQENRERIKQNFKSKLSLIINSIVRNDINNNYKFLIDSQSQKKIELSKQLDLELNLLQSEKIILNLQEFHNQYEIQEILGEGCLGLVKKIKNKQTGELFAVKIVSTTDEEIIRNMIIEFNNLNKLQHENIVKVYQLFLAFSNGFQSESSGYIVMEYIEGDEMFEQITKNGHYNESHAKQLFKQLISAIEYMHKHGICHRDLKPHNILCTKENNQVKVTDFNISKFSDGYKDFTDILDSTKIEMWTYTGTVAFSAPEIFAGNGYNQMVDLWSAGCVLYSMLSGELPFNATFLNDLIDKIIKAEFDFPEQYFSFISDDAKDLIKKLLQKNPLNRIKPKQALMHSWFVNDSETDQKQSLKTLSFIRENIQKFINKSTNKIERRNLLIRTHSNQNLDEAIKYCIQTYSEQSSPEFLKSGNKITHGKSHFSRVFFQQQNNVDNEEEQNNCQTQFFSLKLIEIQSSLKILSQK